MGDEGISGEYDVVVVGAGIMGSCIAYQVAKRGKSVLLLEQYDFLHRRGSSHGESRTIRITYPEDYYTEMMLESYKLWADAERDAGYAVYTKTGQLDFGPRDDPSLAAVIRSLQKFHLEHEILTPAQVARRFPSVSLPDDSYAIFTEQGGTLRASKAVSMFLALAAKHGATLRDRAKVERISPPPQGARGVSVSTSRGTAIGRKCILASGSWAPKLVRQICNVEIPVVPLHTSIAYWAVEEAESHLFTEEGGFPVFLGYGENFLYGTPSIEYPGLIKVSLHSGTVCDPDNRNVAPDLAALESLVSPFLASVFRGKVKHQVPVLAEGCIYSMTPDEDFILDFLPAFDSAASGESDVLIAAGFSGHGFKMGPLVGRIMADLALTGTAPGVPMHHFSLKRFSENPAGNVKDIAAQVLFSPAVA